MADNVLDLLKEKAKSNLKKIIFTESEDSRIIEAVKILKNQGICEPILISYEHIDPLLIDNIKVIIPNENIIDKFARELFDMLPGKFTFESAKQEMHKKNFYGNMLVKLGEADGLISGAICSTADTLRPALFILGTKEGIKTASSYFLMQLESKNYLFADCGFVIDPTEEQLCEIAYMTAESAKLYDMEPKIAMLSYSTKGSGHGPSVDKVIKATECLKDKMPGVICDGELQLDAAIIPDVAQKKCPNSLLQGNANILIFPDLNSGNIGYKLVQRLAHANAFGPIVQGLKKPVNDLSRGCSVEDIVNVAIITAVMAQNY